MIQWVYYVFMIYLFISFIEWFIHKNIMHGDADKLGKVPFIGDYLADVARCHKQHHMDVLMNMDYVNPKLTDGFVWLNTLLFIVLTFIYLRLITSLDNKTILILVTMISVTYSFIWNTIHNSMHNTTETIKITQGVPSILIDNTPFKNNLLYQKLYVNHAIHHLQKGDIKYNFNIIFPFFDYIFLTKKYGVCFDNTNYCRNVPDNRCKQMVKGCVSKVKV